MRPPLPKRPHLSHETRSIFQGRQFNARSALRLDNARQLEAEITLVRFRHRPNLKPQSVLGPAERPDAGIAEFANLGLIINPFVTELQGGQACAAARGSRAQLEGAYLTQAQLRGYVTATNIWNSRVNGDAAKSFNYTPVDGLVVELLWPVDHLGRLLQ
jgi:hypothetical protein